MTAPNTPTQSDILEARERAMRHLPPSFRRDVDAGKLDPWGLVQAELCEMIRERNGEAEGD